MSAEFHPEGHRVPARLPRYIQEAGLFYPDGRRRPRNDVRWFFRTLEIGNWTRAAEELWPKLSRSALDKRVEHLKAEFAEVLPRAMTYVRAWSEPMAVAMLTYAMERAMDPKHKDNERMLGVGVKAASDLLDRGAMPRGAKIHGVMDEAREQAERDYRGLLDELVNLHGATVVRQMRIVQENRHFRDYIDEKWPLKDVSNG